jgi:hypothetical protein
MDYILLNGLSNNHFFYQITKAIIKMGMKNERVVFGQYWHWM